MVFNQFSSAAPVLVSLVVFVTSPIIIILSIAPNFHFVLRVIFKAMNSSPSSLSRSPRPGSGKQVNIPPRFEDGCILWLPLWSKIDPFIQDKIRHLEKSGCLNHPVVVLSMDPRTMEATVLVVCTLLCWLVYLHPEQKLCWHNDRLQAKRNMQRKDTVNIANTCLSVFAPIA